MNLGKGHAMTTLENTISMMKTLPETDLAKIQTLTEKLFQRHESEAVDKAVGKFLTPMSRADFMDDIETAEKEIAAGKYRPAKEVWNRLEHKYGL